MKKNFGVGHTLLISKVSATDELPRSQLDEIILGDTYIKDARPAPMQDAHKLAYTVPFEENGNMAALLAHLSERFPGVLVDMETASLESAYLHIVESNYRQEDLHEVDQMTAPLIDQE